uniref:Minor structural protein n=1 Tax=Siphoviridae sp. ctt8434 TaxID=2825703 RepID=A0A8S5U1K1_9CAUD|nr:MAG TPA: minor structural protein [Siphoviridae sp. ctt8434]
MKDFLENLEIGENKVKLSQEEIKSILAEHGKSVKTETEKVENNMRKENGDLKATIDDLKEQINKAPKSDEIESLKSKIAEYETNETKRIEAEKQKALDDSLTTNILNAIGDKKFVNDYTKNAIINDIKSSLKDSNNVGKSAKDLFEELTKDKEGIFDNPNKGVSTPPTGDVNTGLAKENHDRELLGLEPKK